MVEARHQICIEIPPLINPAIEALMYLRVNLYHFIRAIPVLSNKPCKQIRIIVNVRLVCDNGTL